MEYLLHFLKGDFRVGGGYIHFSIQSRAREGLLPRGLVFLQSPLPLPLRSTSDQIASLPFVHRFVLEMLMASGSNN